MSMSDGFILAIAKACGPDSAAPVTVRSGMLAMLEWLRHSPTPRTYTGFFFSDLARAAEVSTIAPPPSTTRQQSRTVNGYDTMRAFRTCSTVRGSFSHAFGFLSAHLRADTATSASCSRVVPYWCMWRIAAIAYELIGEISRKGAS